MSYKYCRKHDNIVKEIKLKDSVLEYCPACKKEIIFKLMGYKIYHKEVQRFHNSDSRVKVCWAPRRTTKSYSAAHDIIPLYLMPDTITWIVAPTYDIGEKEFRVIYKRVVIECEKLGIDKPVQHYNSVRTGNLYIRSAWNSVVQVKSAERPVSLLGDELDGILYSEAAQIKADIRERYLKQTTITTAKKRGTGYEWIPTTPFQSAEWVRNLCLEGQKNKNKRFIESFHWDHTANPEYDVAELERAKIELGANSPAFREQYLGEWVFYGGSVYTNFNEDEHIIEPFKIPDHWRIVRGIDFGGRDPFVCIWAAIGPESEIYIFQEYYHDKGVVPMKQHADKIKEMSLGMNIYMTVGDPEATQSIEDLNQEGIFVISAEKDRATGRMRVADYLASTPDGVIPFPLKDTKEQEIIKNRPRMYIFRGLKEFLRELRYYRFKERRLTERDKESTEGDCHAMDCWRYICMTRPAPFRARFKHNVNSVLGTLNQLRVTRLIKGQMRKRY